MTVALRYRPEHVRLSVRNTRPTGRADPRLSTTGSGSGLLGLRERVELVHGTLRAGPDDDGGFHVEAELPVSVDGEP